MDRYHHSTDYSHHRNASGRYQKVLAYSTVSQLGLMFAAIGMGAYVAAVFHVLTHAFFKALLFMDPVLSSTQWAANRT